eukprot:CAMPEP_0170484938 /NCGR_PEP_ID=MMETSP0208-20121228/4305_1 /TAXON_ID=197538 /ORGANISM="Strombidium inclinatum, Strain S3" /LENGTH=255 /DNA_ID=CAMNT_0010758425 /DNA_START=570 /DNA_END=1337 /DNA_ORIENTATION=-
MHRLIDGKKEQMLARESFRSKLAELEDATTKKKEKKSDKKLKKQDPDYPNRLSCMVYPEEPFKNNWDLLITITLVFTCLVVPVRIAFSWEDDLKWMIINYTIDFVFIIDILITFNSAYYDDDFKIVDNRKILAKEYLTSWFLIDVLAVIPFDQLSSISSNDMGAINKLTRIYKLTKLTRLIRIMKLFKKSSGSIFKHATELLKISAGFERLFGFFMSFFLLCHIVGCLWLMVALLATGDDNSTWIDPYSDLSEFE